MYCLYWDFFSQFVWCYRSAFFILSLGSCFCQRNWNLLLPGNDLSDYVLAVYNYIFSVQFSLWKEIPDTYSYWTKNFHIVWELQQKPFVRYHVLTCFLQWYTSPGFFWQYMRQSSTVDSFEKSPISFFSIRKKTSLDWSFFSDFYIQTKMNSEER